MKLDTIIQRTRRRLWFGQLTRYAGACLLTALVLAIVVASTDKILFLDVPVVSIVLIMVCLAVLAAIVLTLYRTRADAATAARAIDSSLDLSDRVTSAVMLDPENAWGSVIRADAEKLISRSLVRQIVPFTASWPTRLIIPAIVMLFVILALPYADVLGRMQRKSQIKAETYAVAIELRRAVQAMQTGQENPTGAGPVDSVESLRLEIVRMEREGRADGERRLDLADKLSSLAKQITRNTELVKALERTSEALKRGDADAQRMLEAVQAELARLEESIRETSPQSVDWTAQNTSIRPNENQLVAQPESLVETQVMGRDPQADSYKGVLYSPRSTGVSEDTGAAMHDTSALAAAAQIDAGRIPPGYITLVKNYFNSIKPAVK